jgi:hypothetical protein
MSEQNTPAEVPAAPAQTTEQLPEWARKAISEANGEAASYRQKAKTAAEEAKAAVAAEYDEQIKALSGEKTAITAERDSAATNYTKLMVALQAGVPGETAVEFAGLLQGSNEDEFKAHAEKLKGMFGAGGRVKAVDPSHGLNGTSSQSPDEVFAALFQSNLSKR